jgi:flavin-dependent dehydrogenase
MTVRWGDLVLSGTPTPIDGLIDQYCVRRTILDTILVDAAAEAGAEVREGFGVSELLFDGDRVAGIRGRRTGGSDVVERASLVVGADGLHSLVAEAVDAPARAAGPPLTCCAYAYWSAVGLDHAEIHVMGGRAISAYPTNDDLVCVSVQWPATEAAAFRADLEANFLHTLELAPALAGQLAAGNRVRPFVVTTDLPNILRTPCGPGWALAGDARRHRDPLLAQGIADAFHDAELLAQAIDSGLSGDCPMDDALATYERERNQPATPGYVTTRLDALEGPEPEIAELLSSLQASPERAGRFLGVLAGSVPVSEFFDATTKVDQPCRR